MYGGVYLAIFGWKKPDEARPYIESANKLKQARIAMRQHRIANYSDEKIANYLKHQLNQILTTRMVTPTGLEPVSPP